MSCYTTKEHSTIMRAWGALVEWARGDVLGEEIETAFKTDRHAEDTWTARTCCMEVVSNAYWNHDKPITPSTLLMRPHLIRLYCAVSFHLKYFDEARYRILGTMVLPLITEALEAREQMVQRLIASVGKEVPR